MAGNFLEDVIGFLTEMAHTEPDRPYPRHIASTRGSGEASYHDMAELFGFRAGGEAYRYRCGLAGSPSNATCFAAFSRRLNSFFHGEHPTRITYFRHEVALPGDKAPVVPARTVYTGNYVFRADALDWFIPFAPLRLRMSGPTMGRLLKAELADDFVSANLPMLHRRTLEATGQSEFRPGVVDQVVDQDRLVDLGGEFERQFHGDVLLFTMERLTALGYPRQALAEDVVTEVLDTLRDEIRQRYLEKQQAILERLAHLETLLNDPAQWWNQSGVHGEGLVHFRTFVANIRRNFGPESPCYARIDAPGRWAHWRSRQVAAICGLQGHRKIWARALAALAPSPTGGGRGREGGGATPPGD
jgi:hypothetical protein